jgi:hypothetical protein
VDLLVGACTLSQEGDGMVDVEVNELSVQQDLDQTPEEPKASSNIEEGKPRVHLTLFLNSYITFRIYVMICAFKFRELI